MRLDLKSFFLGLVTGGAVMLILCVALLFTAAWLMNRRTPRADVGPAPKFCPLKDFAVLVCVNQSGDQAFQATDDAVVALFTLLEKK